MRPLSKYQVKCKLKSKYIQIHSRIHQHLWIIPNLFNLDHFGGGLDMNGHVRSDVLADKELADDALSLPDPSKAPLQSWKEFHRDENNWAFYLICAQLINHLVLPYKFYFCICSYRMFRMVTLLQNLVPDVAPDSAELSFDEV
jgi:hypothetical protein